MNPSTTAPLSNGDHNIVEWTLDAVRTGTSALGKFTKRSVRHFPQSACDAFGRWCSSNKWFEDVADLSSASELSSSFTSDVTSAVDRFFPTKTIKIHCSDKPWMSPALKQLVTKRQKAFRSGDKDQWLYLKNKVRKEISARKESYYFNKVQHLKSSDPRKWWDCIRQFSGKKSSSANIKIVKESETILGQELTELLNKHFLEVTAHLPRLDACLLPAYLPMPAPVPTVTPVEVCGKMAKVSAFKSRGPDNEPNQIIKRFCYELADPVCTIFNTSLSTGVFPDMCKDAFITPIPKSQPVTSEDDLRPIALTSCLSKILEDFVVKWLLEDIKHRIDPQQFGSLKGASTPFCLIDMINNWMKSLDSPSHYLRICFVDFSKAFDHINHNILINKLLELGVRSSIVPWICSFLGNPRQSVKIEHFQSDWGFVNGGVPQGTKLGPVLFLAMINDLQLKSPRISTWKYIDDVTISENVTTQDQSSLQTDLDSVSQWAQNNDMKLNGKKCKEMVILFFYAINQPSLASSFDDQQLERVSVFKVNWCHTERPIEMESTC